MGSQCSRQATLVKAAEQMIAERDSVIQELKVGKFQLEIQINEQSNQVEDADENKSLISKYEAQLNELRQ